MKKVLPILVAGILLITGVIANPSNGETKKKIVILIPSLTIEEGKNYTTLHLNNASYLISPGKPMMPEIVKIFELPFGVKNIRIEVKMEDIKEMEIKKKVAPAAGPVLMIPLEERWRVIREKKEDAKIYGIKNFFPYKWYKYKIGCGLNSENKRVTYVSLHLFPIRYSPALNKLRLARKAEITISYEKPNIKIPQYSVYDMVIIAPSVFSKELQRLMDHKNSVGVSTILKTTEEIYSEYNGRDKAEKIKYFIKDAIEKWNIKYVLLVGGLNSPIWAKPRDNANIGEKDWYVPVRYTNLYDNPKYPLAESIHDPGIISDLYYADVYKEGGAFEDWDPNHDGIFAAWNKPGVENDTGLDLYPDVAVGRIACRNIKEVRTVVDKIINYENNCNPSWFKKMIVVSGDGFLDQEDLNITWNTNGLPNGDYTIYAQSINKKGEKGPIDVIHVTIDKTKETKLSFNHDDHLNPALKNGYPALPIAEIVSVSNGDIIGNTDYHYSPGEDEAYLNTFYHWADIDYKNGILTIRGKSYDPEPYGNLTNIHIWIEESNGKIIFSKWRNDTEMYYEGEWTTGEKLLMGRGGALYYMPPDFEKEILWTSNGKFTGQKDVLEAINKGSGFLFMSGHGSPNVWADHFPGIPGNRRHASVVGLYVTTLKPWFPYIGFPIFPIDTLSNKEKLPVAVIGGCHNSQFNVSVIPAVLNALHLLFKFFPNNYMWTYGQPVPECLSWRLVRNPNGGSIASIGNTGLGYGMPGKVCTIGGGDSWITIEFFRQYGFKNQKILGNTYEQTITSYINNFDMSDMEAGHTKTVEEWALLGDPSLMIGGYKQ